MANAALRSYGKELQDIRLAREESLDTVADHLRIKPAYIEALEAGDFSRVPGRTYALGFARSYGEYLGFDGDEVVRLYKRSLDGPVAPTRLEVPRPVADDRRSSNAFIAASILVAGMLYGGWHVLFRDDSFMDRVAALPGEVGRMASSILTAGPDLARTIPEPAKAPVIAEAPVRRSVVAATPPTPVVQPKPVIVALEAVEADDQRARSALPLPVTPPAVVAAYDASSAQAAETPQLRSPSELLSSLNPVTQQAAIPAEGKIVLVARDSAWVQIRSPGRDFIRTRTMEPGERYALPDRSDLALWTGNAGGVEVLVDGQSLGVLGEPGKVVRDVPLSAEALRSRAAPAHH